MQVVFLAKSEALLVPTRVFLSNDYVSLRIERSARYDIDMREIGIGGYGKAGFRFPGGPPVRNGDVNLQFSKICITIQ